jgi:hypothetical protein
MLRAYWKRPGALNTIAARITAERGRYSAS